MKKTIPRNAVLIPPSAELKFKGIIYDTYQWSQKLFDETEATFEMLKRPDTVSSICIVDGKILVLKDEQPHSGLRMSFPGGRVDDDDESINSAARREVHEETGYEFRNWKLLKVWQPHTKIEWFIHLYLAWDVIGTDKPHVDAGERITVQHLSFDEIKNLVINDRSSLGEAQTIFEYSINIDDLINHKTFKGSEVVL